MRISQLKQKACTIACALGAAALGAGMAAAAIPDAQTGGVPRTADWLDEDTVDGQRLVDLRFAVIARQNRFYDLYNRAHPRGPLPSDVLSANSIVYRKNLLDILRRNPKLRALAHEAEESERKYREVQRQRLLGALAIVE